MPHPLIASAFAGPVPAGPVEILLVADAADEITAVFGPAAATSLIGQPLADVAPELSAVHCGPASGRVQEQIRVGRIVMTYSPLYLGSGTLAGSCVTVRCSEGEHEVHRLQGQVSELEEELKAIFDASFDELYVTDPAGVTLRVSRSCERLYGRSRQTLIGRRVSDLQKEGLFDTIVTPRVVAERRPVTIAQTTANGRQMLVTGNPVVNSAGSVVRVVTNSRDMTELIALHREVEQVKLKMSRYGGAEDETSDELLQRGIIARSPAILKLLEVVRRAAAVDVTVLILGETGTGKNVVARYVHQMSPRATNPFLVINCAAIPETLLESELFGYEKGAFTGSSAQGKPGILEAASGGTLVLDEIGELSVKLQAKLLQFLQEGQLFRVGGIRPIRVNTRIVANTNRKLAEMVAQGSFREDLFYRLNIVPIRIPPLRERLEDIPLLIDHTLKRLNEKYGVARQFTPDAVTTLMRHHWPGNVRQLEHLLEFLYIFCQHKIITPEDLPADLMAAGTSAHNEPGCSPVTLGGRSLDQALDEVERTLLQEALRKARSTRELGRILGISQTSVVRKLHKHKLAAQLVDS